MQDSVYRTFSAVNTIQKMSLSRAVTVVLESVLSFTCEPSPFLVMMERPEGGTPSGNSVGH
ncbi:hypothetical protein Hamer_G012901 [Homarus americanus]|uniref:Uncharacterized protein n=1 Tax=Homarus americanus TaxID=6706 RepID=A0A8J5K3F2_HOMAM|nr:hypothetical protein Hamer_G012901 [Homarus americanus]